MTHDEANERTPDKHRPAADDDEDLPDELVGRMLEAGAGAGDVRGKWQPPLPEVIERFLPDYEVHEMIGCGGMGVVYRGVQRSLERAVAIKVLAPEVARSDPQLIARFKNEARAMARLSHPHIVPVYDFGEAVPVGNDAGSTDGPIFYIVMECVDATDLARVLEEEGRLPFARVAGIITQVCEALEFSHKHGIVHRDVKPSNVLIDHRGQVKVADFGLAKEASKDGEVLTSSKIVMGTRRYMSPEQAQGRGIDHRTDIYSVGAMFYEMLTGETPHGAFEPPSHHVQLDTRVDEVVLRALARDPARRYATAAEFKNEVMRLVNARPPGPSSRRVSSGLIVALLVCVITALGGAALFRRSWQPGPPAAAAASHAGDIQRDTARLALDAGARIGARAGDGVERTVAPGGTLPTGPFKLVSIRFDTPGPNPPVLSSSAIIGLCRAPDLEVLSFYQTKPEFNDATFAAIGALRHLREFNANNPTLKDEWLRHLSGSTALSLLRFPSSTISDAGLSHLARIRTLSELDFSKSAVTGAGLAKMTCGDSLIRLTFGDPKRPLTRDEMAAVAGHFPKLERLAITGPVDGEALRPLKALKFLRTFVFTNSQRLMAAHFRALEESSARHIMIINASVNDDAWEALAALKQVDTVQFTNMRWPAACERALAGMKSLRTVILADGPAEDVARASAALPNVTVQKTGYDPRDRYAPPVPATVKPPAANHPPLVEMAPARQKLWEALVRKHADWRAKKKADPATPDFILHSDDHRLIAERMLTLGGRPTLKMPDGRLTSRVPGQELPAGEWMVTLLGFEMPVRTEEVLPKSELLLMLAIPENEGFVAYSVNPELDGEVMRQLGRHHGLRWIGIEDTQLMDEWLEPLEPCDQLEAVCLPRTGIGDAGIAHLQRHALIKNLALPSTSVTGEAIARLACAPTLEHVFFGKKDRHVGADIRSVIRACPQLLVLHVEGQFSGADLADLRSLSRLQMISFGVSRISADVIDALAEAGFPRQLRLSNCQLEDAAWESVKKLAHLHTLTFQGDHWPDAASAALRSLRTLMRLELLDNARPLAPQVRAAVPGLTVVTN